MTAQPRHVGPATSAPKTNGDNDDEVSVPHLDARLTDSLTESKTGNSVDPP